MPDTTETQVSFYGSCESVSHWVVCFGHSRRSPPSPLPLLFRRSIPSASGPRVFCVQKREVRAARGSSQRHVETRLLICCIFWSFIFDLCVSVGAESACTLHWQMKRAQLSFRMKMKLVQTPGCKNRQIFVEHLDRNTNIIQTPFAEAEFSLWN